MTRTPRADARLRVLLAASGAVSFEQDDQLRYVWVQDPTGARDTSAWIGRTDFEVLPDPSEAAQVAELKQDAMQGRRGRVLHTFTTWRGRRHACTIAVEPVFESDGRVAGVAGAMQLGGPAVGGPLEFVLEQLNAMLSSTSAHVYVKSIDGRYTVASRRVEEIAGQPVVGRTDYELFAPEVAEANARRDRATLERGEPVQAEEVLDGHSALTVRIPLLDDSGTPYALCGIAVDITAYKQITERLMNVQRLEVLGNLAAEITHEFQNVLSVILTFSDIVFETVDDERVRYDTEMIRSAARRGADITSQLLAFGGARGSAGDAPVMLADAIVDAERLLTRTLAPDITIETRIGAKATWVDIGAVRLQQILLNLALNARDAMPGGGQIIVSTGRVTHVPDRVTPRLDAGRPYVSLAVVDTGTGMPDDVALRALEPYFTTKGPGGGSGLGLATVLEIVKQAGGGLSIETAEGRGTTVRVYLPVAPASRRKRFVRPAPTEPTPAVVVVAEGDDELREGMKRTLTRAGYVALVAADADEVVSVVEACDGGVDLLLLDTSLAGGADAALSWLSGRAPDAAVLGVAGDGHDGDVEPLLLKPFTAAELLAEVRTTLASAPREPSSWVRDPAGGGA